MNACSSCLMDARWSCSGRIDPDRLIPWRLATAATETDQIEIRCVVHASGNNSHAQMRLDATRSMPPRSRGRRENEQAEERPLDGQVL